ncbi:hypothetical protein ACF9IK_20000 [Kitasatospora hibisci]|uniref:hypothetical protein n=1 Tax=Kitasatospora hibisci TaxID=3369522 RepID=UPI003754BF46
MSARRPVPIGDAERARVAILCEDASALILAEAGTPLPEAALPVAKVLAVRMVGRALDNPGGFTAETIGSYSYQRDASASAGLGLTEDERAQLRRLVGLPQTASPKLGLGYDRADRRTVTDVGWPD